MILVYIDESGINYKKTNGLFKDGPYLIWCGMLITEKKYFHLERLFCELAKDLGIKDWRQVEAHATDIWACKKNFNHLSKKIVRKYFEELFQLLVKLDIQIVIGLHPKKAYPSHTRIQKDEKNQCRFALLHGLEYRLSQLSETGVIISDESDIEIDDLLFERTQWRFNPGARKPRKQRSRYRFETQSCFLLDRVHFIDSKKSVFLQIVDQIAFVIQRVFTFSNLKCFPREDHTASKEMVPLSSETFAFASPNILMSSYSKEKNDIEFTEISEILIGSEYLRLNNLPEIFDPSKKKKK